MVVYLAGCASSQLKKLKASYDVGDYEQVIQSQLDCREQSISCFEIAYLKAESYYHLDDLNNALNYATDATQLIPGNLPLFRANEASLLRAKVALAVYLTIHDWDNRTAFLREVESALQTGIEKNRAGDKSHAESGQLDTLNLLMAETVLHKMDLYSDSNLDIQFNHLLEVISFFSPNLIGEGVQKYYYLQGELKKIMPQVRAWIYQGKLSEEREMLLEQLKLLYTQALAVRNLPLYESGYKEQIDHLLSQVDEYMKKLIL